MSKKGQAKNRKDNPIVFMFSGQGSQYYQMALQLYQHDEVFKFNLEKLDHFVKNKVGYSIIDFLYMRDVSKTKLLLDIELSHPAIVMVEFSLAKSLIAKGIKPDYLLGASLGEFTAAALAGVIDIENLLTLVLHQADQLDYSQNTGAMIAILADSKKMTPLLLSCQCELAGRNYDQHCIAAGRQKNIDSLEGLLRKEGISFQKLPVEYAFHSTALDDVKDIVLPVIESQIYKNPTVKMISCVTGNEIKEFTSQHLWQVIREPIQFEKTIRTLEKEGDFIYIDLGPSSTFTNFVKQIRSADSRSECMSILDPYGEDLIRMESVIEQLKPTAIIQQQDVNLMNIYAFPGQGSQHKGMGAELFKKYPDLVKQADDILGYSIEQLCLNDSKKELGLTQFTQPALYVVNALSYLAELEKSGKPDVLMGHSLGEYIALFAANVFDFSTGLRLVQRRGELMSQVVSDGGMAAVLNCDEAKIQTILIKSKLQSIDVANFNTHKQVVISGPKKELKAAEKAFMRAQATFIPLNVSAPFHSRYMAPVVKQFREFLDSFDFKEPEVPVIANVTARPYLFSDLKRVLANQISSPVKWSESIRYLLGHGITEFKELGPGEVLTKMFAVINGAHITDATYNNDELLQAISQAEANITKEYVVKTITRKDTKKDFQQRFGCRFNYVIGSVGQIVSSTELVLKAAKSNIFSYLGTENLALDKVSRSISDLNSNLTKQQHFGVNVSANIIQPNHEVLLLDLLLEKQVIHIEVTGYTKITSALVKYRLNQLSTKSDNYKVEGTLLAKVNSAHQAKLFLEPAPVSIIKTLLLKGEITEQQARWATTCPMADAIAYDGDNAVLPQLLTMRDNILTRENRVKTFIGSSKSIGSPHSIASAFVIGAEFVMSDTINQCTAESGLNEHAKNLLQQAQIDDVILSPSAELFEFGHKVSVLNKGTSFARKANTLHRLWQRYDALDDFSPSDLALLENQYFPDGVDSAFQEASKNTHWFSLSELKQAEQHAKFKLTVLFKFYLKSAHQHEKLSNDLFILCGPEMGAFNYWLQQGRDISWKNRHVDTIAEKVMEQAQELLAESA